MNIKKINIFILGSGNQGSKIYKILKSLNTNPTIGNKLDFTINPDWVYIATPNIYHFEQAEKCLRKNIKVILEKPPTFNPDAYFYLLDKYGKNNICCVDMFTRHKHTTDGYDFKWNKETLDSHNTSLLYRLAYHHIQLLVHNNIDGDIKIFKNTNECIKFNVGKYSFEYKIDFPIHIIFGKSFNSSQNVIKEMLNEIFLGKFDFDYNAELTLKTLKLLSKIRRKLFKKILIVGGGIFGCTTAIYLSNAGIDVTLIEKNDDIFKEASFINQYRVHRGYHYPRSHETIKQCSEAYNEFEKFFRDAIMDSHQCLYSISSQKSKVSAKDYLSVLDKFGLKYIKVKTNKNCDLTINGSETLYNPHIVKKILKDRLYACDVKLVFNRQYDKDDKMYSYVINSTYSNLNTVYEAGNIQFEVCEKPVLKLPEKYKNISHVIMDGPFMCIDPFADTGYHVLGNVVHAIHHTNIGKFPEVPNNIRSILNAGIIKNPKITNIKKFIETAKDYFPDIENYEHIGSMYTVRAVLPYRDKDDYRPSLVNKNNRYINVFSGKVSTVVNVAKLVFDRIK